MSPVQLLSGLVGLCLLSSLCVAAAVAAPPSGGVDIVPQQVHISLGHTATSLTFSWMSWSAPVSARVLYGLSASELHSTVHAHFHAFVDGGSERLTRFMYNASVHGLQPGQHYFYRAAAANETGSFNSTLLDFHTVPADVGTGADKPLRVGLLGDWGLINGTETHNSLQRLVERQGLDLLVHVGDISYNLATDNGRVGDSFLRREQSVAGRVAYQVAVGNHEGAYNFSHYLQRFAMPNEASGSPSSLYSSFNVGPVHFISFDAERYFVPDYLGYTAMPTMEYVRQQYEWLQRDLHKAHGNRDKQPWIVAYAHRPMYCTHIDDDWDETWCTEDAAALRDGVAFNGGPRQFGLEQLFHNYSVDLYVSGHMHSYERTYPVYREQLVNTNYRDNAAMWHLIVGASGCQGPMDTFDEGSVYPWSAARSDSYGYGVLNVYNATHMQWQQILDEDESVLDEVWVVKAAMGGPSEMKVAAAAAAAAAGGARHVRG